MWRHLLIALAVSPLVAPAAGHAATVGFHPLRNVDPKANDSSYVTVIGDDGADDLRLAWTDTGAGGTFDAVDPTRPVTVLTTSDILASSCSAVDEHHVRCTVIGFAGTHIAGRDGDDRLTLSGSRGSSVSGGAGDDVIRTGDGQDQVDGGPGADVLDTGAGDDVLIGGADRDEQHGGLGDDAFSLSDALGDGETLDGGPGRNRLAVSDPGQPLEVDLAAGRVISPRGVTELVGFQDASVFAKAPVVLGNDGPNRLQTGPKGRVEGRGGDDELFGGSGAILDGGAGDDRFATVDRLGALRCGPGIDVVEDLGATIRPADCEGAHTWVGFVSRTALRGRAIAVGLDASAGYEVPAVVCGIRVQALTTAGRPATAALRLRGAGIGTLRLPLKVAKAPKVVRLRVRYASACPRGGPPWTYAPKGNAVWPAVTLTR
jgi:hypothetical protein